MAYQRDRSNELVVAIVVIGTITLALALGIILTLSSNVDQVSNPVSQTPTGIAADSSPTPTIAPTQAADAEPTRTPTTAPSDTPTDEPSATATEEPSATPTEEPSLTATESEPDAAIDATSDTATEAAVLPEASRTPTEEPNATPTRKPSNTPRPSRTPTLTPTPTASFTPTASHTPTASNTPTVTVTASNTPTRTEPPSPTFTPTPRATLTFTPYPSLTPSHTPFGSAGSPTPQPSGCTVPSDWVAYTIQPGDTIFGLARRFQLPREELTSANCLENPNNITAGQLLFVPPNGEILPGALTPDPGFGGAPQGSYGAINCDSPAATITQPLPGTVLRGTFAVFGTATHPNFQFYRLQVSGGGQDDADFATVDVYPQQVTNGQLGIISAGAFAPGDYWIRLTVVDRTGNYPPQCTIRVRFEN